VPVLSVLSYKGRIKTKGWQLLAGSVQELDPPMRISSVSFYFVLWRKSYCLNHDKPFSVYGQQTIRQKGYCIAEALYQAA
jgi:hypothetical protein